MRRHWLFRGLKFALLGALCIAVFGFVVMSLWNGLMPDLFGLRTINFWQALGIIILGRILFGGFRGHHRHHTHWRHRMKERWNQMTPEEREQFRQGIRHHCRAFRTAETQQ